MNTKSDKQWQLRLRILIGVYILTVGASFYHHYQAQSTYGMMMTCVAILVPCIVPIAFKIFKLQKVTEIYCIWIAFSYFASLVGSGLEGYSYPGYDKVLHFLSGFLAMLFAIVLYFYFQDSVSFSNPKEFAFFIIFSNAINMAIALLWEVYEYALLIGFNYDCINHNTQGVHDSLTDMICAMFAGFLLTGLLIYNYRKHKQGTILILCEKFYARNAIGGRK